MFYIIWLEVALFSNYFGYEISWDNIKSRIPNIDARSRDLLTANMRHFRMRSFFNFYLRVSQILENKSFGSLIKELCNSKFVCSVESEAVY